MTALVITANRIGPNVSLLGTATTIAADAQISNLFTLPAGFGDLWLRSIVGTIHTFSAAYVAPVPPYDGLNFYVVDSANVTAQEIIGASRFVHGGTSGARPTLMAFLERYERALIRRDEQIVVQAPILAGAGATVSVQLFVTGVRVNTA